MVIYPGAQASKEGFLSILIMKFLFLLIAMGHVCLLFAQDEISWAIYHDKKLLFTSTIENEEQNILTVSPGDLKNNRNFTIAYSDEKPWHSAAEWRRTIGIFTTADRELLRKDSSIVKIPD